jgi:hypothetical protein
LYNNDNNYKIRTFQGWAKIFDVPFQYHFGRKYYIISDEIKDLFIKLDKNKKFYYEMFPKKIKVKIERQNYHKQISSKDINKLIKIAREQETH